MISILLIFAPIPVLILWIIIRYRIQRRKAAITQSQTPAPTEKPYDPKPEPQPVFFLRNFSLPQRTYLRQQFAMARMGFYICLWIFTVLLAAPLLPSEVNSKYLVTHQQQVWFSFVNGATLFSAGLPAFCAIMAAIIAASPLVSTQAVFYRTRPVSLRFLFWSRILCAAGSLLAAALVAIALSFATLRIAYGPAWQSVPQTHSVNLGMHHGLINFNDDETPAQAAQRRLTWLEGSSPTRIFLSTITSMMLLYAAFATLFFQPYGHKRAAQSIPKWFSWMIVMGAVFLFNIAKHASLPRIGRFVFYNPPWQPSPAWQYLPIPIVLTVVLFFLSERFCLRRDV